MFNVYWMAQHIGYEPKPHNELFDSDKMVEALDFMKALRDNPVNSFVTMSSENPNQVGKMGVTQVDADYHWTKRRNNERKFHSNDAVEVPMDEE